MGKRNKVSIRQVLLARRRALLRRSENTLAEEQQLLEQVEPDWEDVAANISAAQLLDRMSDVDLIQLRRVQAALERLDHGTYGECTRCRRPIERRRLQVLPEADRCASCACAN
jgi:RNA polymerase-binding transcription factor DksA